MTIRRQIRIKDLAKLANVSIGTVDRVLHNRGEVSSATRNLILKLIEEEDYTPNLLAKSLASRKQYRFAVLAPEKSENPYWEKPILGLRQAEAELKNFNVTISLYEFTDEISFRVQAQKMIASHPDGIVIAPLFYKSSLETTKICEQQNIPFVFFDVAINGCNHLAFFGQDARISGFIGARLLNMALKANAQVLILKLVNRFGIIHHLDEREKGFREFFSATENRKKRNVESAEISISDELTLFRDLDQIFINRKGPVGVFVLNSRVHKVALYLGKRNIRNAFLIGYDLLDENIYYLDSGLINFLICQKPEVQGYKSAMALFSHLVLKQKVEKINFSAVDIILKENRIFYQYNSNYGEAGF